MQRGPKGSEVTFWPFGPVGVPRRRLLQKMATSYHPAQWIPTRRLVTTDFWQKRDRCGAINESIRKIPKGKTTKILVALHAFLRGPKWSVHFLHMTQKERCADWAECTLVTLFPYDWWVWRAKTQFGPVSGVSGPKRVLENSRRPLDETPLPGRLWMNPENPILDVYFNQVIFISYASSSRLYPCQWVVCES